MLHDAVVLYTCWRTTHIQLYKCLTNHKSYTHSVIQLFDQSQEPSVAGRPYVEVGYGAGGSGGPGQTVNPGAAPARQAGGRAAQVVTVFL